MDNAYLVAFLLFMALFFVIRIMDMMNSHKDHLYELIINPKKEKLFTTIAKFCILLVFVVFCIGVILLNITNDNGLAKFSIERFGDFFGGTLGPIFSLLSFVGVLWALIVQINFQSSTEETSNEMLLMQKKQLELSEMKRDEESFYLLLENLTKRSNPELINHTYDLISSIQISEYDFGTFLARATLITPPAMRSRFAIFCRIVEHIESSPLLDNIKYIKVLRSFLEERECRLFYALATINYQGEISTIGTLHKNGFIDFSFGPHQEWMHVLHAINTKREREYGWKKKE